VAFGGRALDPSAKAKYLNSPETELFHKGSLLYNHHRARKPAGDKGRVIAVEGYVDVISMTKAGFAETVAPLGTALTVDQCGLLWTMSEEPILCFDGDKAGRKAAYRALETALPLIGPGKSLKFALLPEGQDPDDLARSGGPEAIAAVIDAARPFADMLFQRETEGQAFDTPEKRAGLERRLREVSVAIGDETLRRHYAADLAQRAGALFGFGESPRSRTAYNGTGRPQRRTRAGAEFAPKTGVATQPMPRPGFEAAARREPPREIIILAALIGHPALVDRVFEEIATLEFTSRALAEFRGRLLDSAPEALVSAETLAAALAEAGHGGELKRILDAAARLPDWWCLQKSAEISDAETVLRQCLALQRKTGTLHRDLKSAETALAEDPSEQNFARLLDIKQNLADLASAEAAVEGFGEMSGRRLPPV
jgi:DNA primase